MVFADGADGAERQEAMVLIPADGGQGPDGFMSERDVIGWRAACTCGWIGEPWLRGASERTHHPALRVAYSADGIVPKQVEDGPLFAEWHGHVHPLEQLGFLAAEHSESGRRLDAALAAAHAQGATYTQIATALMSPGGPLLPAERLADADPD